MLVPHLPCVGVQAAAIDSSTLQDSTTETGGNVWKWIQTSRTDAGPVGLPAMGLLDQPAPGVTQARCSSTGGAYLSLCCDGADVQRGGLLKDTDMSPRRCRWPTECGNHTKHESVDDRVGMETLHNISCPAFGSGGVPCCGADLRSECSRSSMSINMWQHKPPAEGCHLFQYLHMHSSGLLCSWHAC